MSLKTDWKDDVLDISMSGRRRYNIVRGNETIEQGVSLVDDTSYSQVGDTFGADDLNEICEEVNNVSSNLTQYAHATLESGETEVVINDNRIVSTSIIEPFFEVALGTEFEPLSYLTMKVEVGKVTFTFDSQSTDIEIYIRVL